VNRIKKPPRPFDVDDTLVFPFSANMPGPKVKIYDVITDKYLTMTANESMIRLMKEEKHRGGHIIVWSRGGEEWARNVVVALKLDDIVDTTMDKPLVYFDDLDVSEWMKDRVYIPPTVSYKK
jgi:hypothetical protein